MPTTLSVRNAHEALPSFLFTLIENNRAEESRNGPVFVYPYPLTTLYERPWEKVVYWHERDANPFFHFQEALWMLGGRNDVAFPATYAKQLYQYSDDGETLHGAYGHRWRHHFANGAGHRPGVLDQLDWAIRRLRNDPNDRRVVISMWDAHLDPAVADRGGKDVPCNTNIFVAVRDGRLCLQVNCRSNDAIWGTYGANAVHMAFLQEYIASHIGILPGWYAQNSFNIHVYNDFYTKMMNERPARDQRTSLRHNMAQPVEARWNPYAEPPGLEMHALVSSPQEEWDEQLGIYLMGGSTKNDGLTDPFFTHVAVPIRDAHAAYRNKQYDDADEIIKNCAAGDWRKGCQDWLARRAEQRRLSAAA